MIDFFVHDILDYTILNKQDKCFIKHIAIFDIRIAIKELEEIMKDKIHMKSISVITKFVNFYEEKLYLIKSDQKRL